MRATNNEKRTLQPVTALTNFAASTILDSDAEAPAAGPRTSPWDSTVTKRPA